MTLSDDELWHLWNNQGTDDMSKAEAFVFARAIEAEVRKDDEALIRQLVASLEGYRRNHNDTQPCDAERAGRAWLEGFDDAIRRTRSAP